MTLIALLTKPRFYAISDTLLSTDERRLDTTISLPFTGTISPIKKVRSYGMAQKMVILNECQTIMWAGNFQTAEKVIIQYYDYIRLKGTEPFRSFLENNFPFEEISKMQFIHTLKETSGRLHTTMVNVSPKSINGYDVIAAGSGCRDFFDSSEVVSQNYLPPDMQVRYEMVSRILYSILSESFAFFAEYPSTIVSERYGGWWELTYQTSEGFAKTPYLVKYWTIKDGKLEGIKGYRCWYEGYNLKILVYVNDKEQKRVKLYDVPDMLQREISNNDALPLQDPDLQMHIVITNDNEAYGHIWCSDDYKVNFHNNEFTECMSKEFIDVMLAGVDSSTAMRLNRVR